MGKKDISRFKEKLLNCLYILSFSLLVIWGISLYHFMYGLSDTKQIATIDEVVNGTVKIDVKMSSGFNVTFYNPHNYPVPYNQLVDELNQKRFNTEKVALKIINNSSIKLMVETARGGTFVLDSKKTMVR